MDAILESIIALVLDKSRHPGSFNRFPKGLFDQLGFFRRPYLTIVLDYETGRVIHVGKDRKAKTLTRFFNRLSSKQKESIEAVVMDMWDPYIKAVKKNCRGRP